MRRNRAASRFVLFFLFCFRRTFPSAPGACCARRRSTGSRPRGAGAPGCPSFPGSRNSPRTSKTQSGSPARAPRGQPIPTQQVRPAPARVPTHPPHALARPARETVAKSTFAGSPASKTSSLDRSAPWSRRRPLSQASTLSSLKARLRGSTLASCAGGGGGRERRRGEGSEERRSESAGRGEALRARVLLSAEGAPRRAAPAWLRSAPAGGRKSGASQALHSQSRAGSMRGSSPVSSVPLTSSYFAGSVRYRSDEYTLFHSCFVAAPCGWYRSCAQAESRVG